MKLQVSWKANEMYMAFPFAFNYYKSATGFIYLTFIFLFFWVRIVLQEKNNAIPS